ncbi:MAG: ribosome-associated translation inhibitor RaiA [Chitinophagaceae bacterium]
MKIDIQSRDFTAKEDLLDFITEKVEKLGRFYDEIISSEVCLALDKSDTNDNKFCEIKLLIPGNDLFASAQRKSFEEATSEAVSALERQIEKRKTKIIGKRVDISEKFDLY